MVGNNETWCCCTEERGKICKCLMKGLRLLCYHILKEISVFLLALIWFFLFQQSNKGYLLGGRHGIDLIQLTKQVLIQVLGSSIHLSYSITNYFLAVEFKMDWDYFYDIKLHLSQRLFIFKMLLTQVLFFSRSVLVSE